ncbi:MAG: carboxypeptidase regulatory-like domain-containing protein [Muribaculaceae bacterium]|nr:carboxypeptidase regulatory-like domain-containing protein [Muribaculaceae bacterium]
MRKILSLILAITAYLVPVSGEAREAMGFLTGSSAARSPGLYTFDLTGGDDLVCVSQMPYFLMGGAYGDSSYWLMLSYDMSGNLGQMFMAVDPVTGEQRKSTGQNYGCSDMTYDVSTSDLYGILYTIGGNTVPNQLVRISTPGGSYEAVATLTDTFSAIACDLWGNLYAMSSTGVLHSVNKGSGAVTPIGATGLSASTEEVQSMEFDRDSGELYWTFLDKNDNTWIAKIDPETGSVIEKHGVEDNALIGALHIPYAEVALTAPGQISDLSTDTSGDAPAFVWKAPVMTVGGDPLSCTLDIEIRREGRIVKVIEGVAPGEQCEWQDPDAPKDQYVTYAITCYDGHVRGASAFVTVYFGEDLPASVSGLEATVSGEDIILKWTAPETDCNGRPIDKSGLTYTITRHPDEMTVEGVTSGSYVDSGIDSPNQYYYTVVPVTHVGAGEGRDSEIVIAGPSLKTPWYPDFSDQVERSRFLIVNANGDSNTWQYKDGAMRFSCMYGAGDDWLISMPVHLESGMTYKMRCDIGTAGAWGPENLRITLGTGFSPDSQNVQEIFNRTGITSTAETISELISVEESGDYTFGLQCYTAMWDGMYLDVRKFEIEPVGAVDLAVEGPLRGELLPVFDSPNDYYVTIFNNGTETQTGFYLSLLDDEDKVLASSFNDSTVAPGESVECKLSWTPMSAKVRHIRARVEKENDVNEVNNLSAPFEVMFLNEGEAIARFGEHDSDPGLFPFSFDNLYSFAESVYTSEELGVEGGMISEISWEFNNPGEPLLDKEIKIYMANTSRSPVMTDYLREEEMICVFDGKADFPSGENRLSITLDEPFPYSGGNLAVMTRKFRDTETGIRVTWQAQNFPNTPRTAVAVNGSGVFETSEVLVSSMLPCVRMRLDTGDGASLSGRVTCDGEDVQGARVSIDGRMTDVLTDASGIYRFNWLPAGQYGISVAPPDFRYLSGSADAAVVANGCHELDIRLDARPSGAVEGKITDDKGNPVPGASVRLYGWESHKTIADMQGNYSFDKIYAVDKAEMTVYAYGYRSGKRELSVSGASDSDPVDIALEAVRNPVRSASVVLDDGIPQISWTPVDFSFDIAADNGVVAGSYETGTYGDYLLAKQFEGPLVIDRIMWHAGASTDPDSGKIDIYIYSLDADGRPQYLLHNFYDVPSNTGEWNEFSIADAINSSVSTPHGCMVALGAVGAFAVSKDDSGLGGSYIIDPAAGAYAPLTDRDGAVNLLIRLYGSYSDPESVSAEPEVTYNVYRLLEKEKDDAQKYVSVATSVTSDDIVPDQGWPELPYGDYVYAVEAVYSGEEPAEPCFTDVLSRSAVESVKGIGFSVIPAEGGIIVISETNLRIEIFTTAGLKVRDVEVNAGDTKITLEPGIYLVRAGESTAKLTVK